MPFDVSQFEAVNHIFSYLHGLFSWTRPNIFIIYANMFDKHYFALI